MCLMSTLHDSRQEERRLGHFKSLLGSTIIHRGTILDTKAEWLYSRCLLAGCLFEEIFYHLLSIFLYHNILIIFPLYADIGIKSLQITPKYYYEEKSIANNSIYININEISLSTITVEIMVLA